MRYVKKDLYSVHEGRGIRSSTDSGTPISEHLKESRRTVAFTEIHANGIRHCIQKIPIDQ